MLSTIIKNKRKIKNRGGMRYSAKEYNNPFFNDKNRNYRPAYKFSLKMKFIGLAVFIIIIAVGWFLLYSSYFTIKNIEITGAGRIMPEFVEKIARQQINNNILIILPQKNIYLFNKQKLKNSLEKKYSFNELSIKKKLPNTLIIYYEEKRYSLVWQENDRYYYADADGAIISETNLLEVKQKDYPLINNLTGSNINGDKITVNENYINYILLLFNKFKQHNPSTGSALSDEFFIDRFIVDEEINTIKILIKNGPEIYFNTNADADKQLNKLVIIKQEKLKDEFNNKTYIDLRIGDSVYYR